jgi:hypothetical protein
MCQHIKQLDMRKITQEMRDNPAAISAEQQHSDSQKESESTQAENYLSQNDSISHTN